MTWPAVKRGFTQDGFADYLRGITWAGWRPNKIIWHNTAAPNLAQWRQTAAQDKANGITPGITRIKNLEVYFRDQNHWSGAPHLFIAPDLIWVFNPLTAPGVHSPSFNASSLGIEMVGDFAVEDDESGDGMEVKANTIFATAQLCKAIGIDPTMHSILLHKEDPRTTHDCPGIHIARDKQAMVDAVLMEVNGYHTDHACTCGTGKIP